jgi:ribosomal subunit interface protein
MQLDIEGRNTDIRPRWRDLIERKLAKAERYPNEVTHARVTITHSPHHNLGDNQVQIVLSVAGRTLTVKKTGAEIPTTLRAALTAAEREVDRYHQQRKRPVSRQSPRSLGTSPLGTIGRIFRIKGYGFIRIENDLEVRFDRSSLDGLSFDDLSKGTQVGLELKPGEKGPQVVRVFPVGTALTRQ